MSAKKGQRADKKWKSISAVWNVQIENNALSFTKGPGNWQAHRCPKFEMAEGSRGTEGIPHITTTLGFIESGETSGWEEKTVRTLKNRCVSPSRTMP